VHIGREVLMGVDDSCAPTVLCLHGISGQQHRPYPIHLLNITSITLVTTYIIIHFKINYILN
jgi:hypothetical protein